MTDLSYGLTLQVPTVNGERAPPRKRFRVPVNCRACRKRKTKCDKTRPKCQYCVENSLECVYESLNSWKSSDATTDTDKSVSPELPELLTHRVKSDTNYIHQLEQELFKLRSKISAIESSIEASSIAIPMVPEVKKDSQDEPGLPLSHPYVNPTDTIDFYARYYNLTSLTLGFLQTMSAFSWRTMIKKDPYIQLLWLQLISSRPETQWLDILKAKQQQQQSLPPVNPKLKPVLEFECDLNLSGDIDVLPKSGSLGGDQVTKMTPLKINFSPIETDSKFKSLSQTIVRAENPKYPRWRTVVPRATTHYQLIKLVLEKLPTKKVIWMLIDRFFKYAYPLMPYLDAETFLALVTKLIGEREMSETKVIQINLTDKLQIADLGILLFVLEFGSFTLLSNRKQEQPPDAETDYLLSHPLSQDNGTLAKYCFAQFKFFKHVSLEILQMGIYRKLHMKFSPQDGDGLNPSESQIFSGLLVQMAVSLGLNRDGDSCVFPSERGSNRDTRSTERLANLKRKIWLFIVMNDSYHTYTISGSSSTRLDFYDTALPKKPSPLNRNGLDDDVELLIYESFQQFDKYDKLVKTFIYDVIAFKPSNVKNILSKLLRLEDLILLDLKSFAHILFHKYASDNAELDNIRKAFSLVQYIELRSLLFMSYYHIFVHYEAVETNDQLALYYLHKTIETGTELSESVPRLLIDSSSFVGPGFDYYLTPAVELMFHKSFQFKYGIQFRLKHYMVMYKAKPPYVDVDDKINKLVRCSMRNSYFRSLKLLLSIADRYYYAWKICKFQRMCISSLLDPEPFFEVGPDYTMRIKGDESGILKPPQSSIFMRLQSLEFLDILNFLQTMVDTKKADTIFDPLGENFVDKLIFGHGYDIGNYSRRSSERTRPLATQASDTANVVNSTPESSSASTYSSSDFERGMITNPELDRWWMDFVNSKSTDQFSDLFGTVPEMPYIKSNEPTSSDMGQSFGAGKDAFRTHADTDGSAPGTLDRGSLNTVDLLTLDEILRYISDEMVTSAIGEFEFR